MEDFTLMQSLIEFSVGGAPKVVVDGGFHRGGFTRKVRAAWPNAQVIGLEPDPTTFGAARRDFGSDVWLENAALGAKDGPAEFFRGAQSATNSLLPRPQSSGRPYYPASAGLSGGTFVEVITLDRFLDERGIERVDLLKIDLQGGEMDALRGASACLSRGAFSVILCEVVFVQKYGGQPLFWEICHYLAEFGYSFHSFHEVKVGPYDPEPSGPRSSQWNQADALFLAPMVRQKLEA